ncbi:hypothetical protein [Moraxella bovoculi]|uniref:hypothetical protein n=1 Tax=Moraxella bovoculi TaxID=386891 RepID=UPI00062496C4|nr:hypothetical protein [Moraxella bovoculi]AKG14169.1 hypothetical protein AAX11_09245 [Moraxella bovoculi]
MALAFSINEETFGSLESNVQGLYAKQDDGSYQLVVDGLPSVDGLKAKTDELLGETKKEREKRKELEAKLAEFESEKAKAQEDVMKKTGDIEALEKSYLDKLAKLEQAGVDKEKALQRQIYELTVGQTATNLANELAIKGSANVLLPHIQNRLTLETGDDGQKIRVLDLQGNISALTLDDLKQEFMANDAFKPLIAGNNASGGGATGMHRQQRVALKRSEMSAEQKAKYIREHGHKAFLNLGA